MKGKRHSLWRRRGDLNRRALALSNAVGATGTTRPLWGRDIYVDTIPNGDNLRSSKARWTLEERGIEEGE
ncbi:MAG: hypothetical protein OTI36_01980 [Beijerinckiaceae bacterium]|nr:hypothetical protein [Beijerinckiaceae bacterium]